MGKLPMRMLIRSVVCVSVVLLAFSALCSYYSASYSKLGHDALDQGAKVGWSRTEVINRLGEPDTIITRREDYAYLIQDKHSYVTPPQYPMDKEVLLYSRYVWRLLVYIGKDERVVHTHLSRT